MSFIDKISKVTHQPCSLITKNPSQREQASHLPRYLRLVPFLLPKPHKGNNPHTQLVPFIPCLFPLLCLRLEKGTTLYFGLFPLAQILL